MNDIEKRSHLDRELKTLKEKLLKLIEIVEISLQNAIEIAKTHNPETAKTIKEQDTVIDDLEIELEEFCLKILALYQPVASDLRYIVATLKINNDIERIGDLSVSIANRLRDLEKFSTDLKKPYDFNIMAKNALKMVRESIESLINLDSELALKVLDNDQAIDDAHASNFKIVADKIKNDPENSNFYILFMSLSRHLERVADLATNIAEDVIYLVTGKIIRHGRGL